MGKRAKQLRSKKEATAEWLKNKPIHQHAWVWAPSTARLMCKMCGRAKNKAATAEGCSVWEGTELEGTIGRLHSSHKLHLAVEGLKASVFFCTVCGGYARTNTRKLLEPCAAPVTRYQEQARKLICRGYLPQKGKPEIGGKIRRVYGLDYSSLEVGKLTHSTQV